MRIFDPDVRKSRLVGTNLAYIRSHVPHFEALLVDDPAEWLPWTDVAVVTYDSPDFFAALRELPAATPLIDLAGAPRTQSAAPESATAGSESAAGGPDSGA